MSRHFDPDRGLIVVPCEVFGPSGSMLLRLALDTGATGTMINVGPLTVVGFDPSLVPGRVQVTTGRGVEFAPRVIVDRIFAMGHRRDGFPILAHTLPTSAGIDGVLGLDFLWGHILNIDFRDGVVTLE